MSWGGTQALPCPVSPGYNPGMADGPSKKFIPRVPVSNSECPKKAKLIDTLIGKLKAKEKKALKK